MSLNAHAVKLELGETSQFVLRDAVRCEGCTLAVPSTHLLTSEQQVTVYVQLRSVLRGSLGHGLHLTASQAYECALSISRHSG
jgi:hypothetical protein